MITIDDYIKGNHPFFHITAQKNEASILKYGLQKFQCNAICVVRTDDEDIVNDIATAQLRIKPGEKACLIRICPKDHEITAEMIAADSVDEPTARLHNYIVTDRLQISKKDIIVFPVKNVNINKERLNEIIEQLEVTGYRRKPIPNIEVDDWTYEE